MKLFRPVRQQIARITRRPIVGAIILALACTSCTREAKRFRASHRAESYFSAGQFDKAKIEYLNLLRLDPGNVLPYERLGAIWLEQGDALRAAPFLVKTRELAPNHLENRLKLARVLLSLGSRAEGFSEAKYVLEHSPNDVEAVRIAAEAAPKADDRDWVEKALSSMSNQSSVGWQLASAMISLRRNNLEAAKQAVEKAVTIDPKSAAAHSFMATLWLLEKKAPEAGNEFKLAADLSPPRSSERVRYAQFQLQTGGADEAIKTLQSVTSAAPDYIPAWLLQADLSLEKKNYDETIKLLANVLNRDPQNIDGNVIQARALVGKGEVDKALTSLQKLDADFPKLPPVKYEIARCYVQKNDSKQAVSFLNQALSGNPDFIDAAVLLAQIDLRTGNAKGIVDLMQPLLAKHPDFSAGRLLLADAYRALGQLDDAAAIFRDQLKTSPDNAQACLALGIILRQQQKNDEARQMLERAAQLAPGNPMVFAQLIDLDLSGKDFEGAQHRIEQQLQSTPNAPFLYYLQGKVYAVQRKFDQAEASLTKALTLNPNFTTAYTLLATVYAASNKLADAARQLELVVAKAPNDARAMMSLAALYEKLNNFEKARDTYEKLLTIAPEFAPALNNLAFIYTEHLPQLDRAYQLAEKARSLQPGDGAIADTFGWVRFKKRDYQQALALLSDAAAKSPGDPEIQYHLGMCRYMMGDTDPARQAFEQALKSPGDFPHKADVERRLALVSKAQTGAVLKTQELEAIVQQQPDDVVARVRLAEKYQSDRLSKQAAAQYDEAIKLSPRFLPAIVSLAELYLNDLNDPAKALDLAKTARDLAPADAHVTLLLGRAAYKAGNYSWAFGLLRQSSDELTNDPSAAHALGWAAFSLGKIPEATAQMQKVVQIAPQSALADDARTWLSMMHAAANPDSSRDEIANVLKKDPNYPPAQLAQAALTANGGSTARAIALYKNFLTRFPDYAPAQKQLARLYLRPPANITEADDLASKARKSLPDDVELMALLADISYEQQDYIRALQLLDEAARKEPLDANHLYLLGMCAVKTNDNTRARDSLNKALTSGLQDPRASDARRTLEALK